MIILAIDSSAVSASAALTKDGALLGEFYIRTRLTHSQTLMPMISDLLSRTQVKIGDIDLFAVSAGPGSFTGIRIGIASIKGLAMPEDKPCVGVSTLEAIARNLAHLNGTVCAAMDARCQQVYNAVFEADSGSMKRLTPDRAISMENLASELKNCKKPIYVVGDGAELCYNSPWFAQTEAVLPPESLLYQRASAVAEIAAEAYAQGRAVSPAALMPVYLRPAQAERALKKQNGGVADK